MGRTRVVLLSCCAVLSIIASRGTVASQAANPASVSYVPSGEACHVGPRSAASWIELSQAKGTVVPSSTSMLTEATLPSGEPVEIATQTATAHLLQEVIARVNGGDVPRRFAIDSDHYLRRLIAATGEPVTEESIAPASDPQPLEPADRLAIAPPREMRRMPDSRVGAVVLTLYPYRRSDRSLLPMRVATTWFVFVKQDKRWRLDDWVTLAEGGDVIPPATPEPEPHQQVITQPLYTSVIVPETSPPVFVRSLSGSSAPGYWTPRGEDVEALEAAVVPYIRDAAARRAPDLWQRLPTYKRQYVGVIDEGREQILAIFFCDDLGIDWRTTPVAVDDGGDCSSMSPTTWRQGPSPP